jgi:hypothetical protein
MKIVRAAQLWLQQRSSDQIYEVDLVENDALSGDRRFLVNIRYGRRGHALREGTRTATPVAREAAERLYDSIVVAKINDGYRRFEAPAVAASAAGDEPDGRARVLLLRLQACLRSPAPSPGLDRLLWRIGEVRLKAATPLLLDMARRCGEAEASYSLVFTLARAAGDDAAPALRGIAAHAAQAVVRELARIALVSPLMGAEQESPSLGPDLPQDIVAAVEARDSDRLAGAIAALARQAPAQVGPMLAALAGLAQADAAFGAVLAAAVVTMPARPPYLIGLRKLYKYAEMTDDAALFAATAHRFETARAMYRRVDDDGRTFVPELGARLPVDRTRGPADARVGLSEATLHYFKRRIWRTLRRRGDIADPSFAELACAYLLGLRPADMARPVRWSIWERGPDGLMRRQPRTMGPLSRNWTASQLLYRHAPHVQARYGSLSFLETGEPDETRRDEAFPDLWTERPDLALKLAAQGGCAPVALFGLRVIAADPAFVGTLPADALARLLVSPHAAVLDFAFEEARGRLARGDDGDDLIAALIVSELPQARRLAVERIEGDPSLPWSSPALAMAAITAAHDDVAEPILRWARERQLAATVAGPLAQAVAGWLLARPAVLDAAAEAAVRAVRSRIAGLWPAHDMKLAQDVVLRLMEHPAAAVAAAGVEALALTGIDPSSLTDDAWRRLLGSPAEDVQEAALALFGRNSDDALARHAPLVIAFATAPSSRLRRAARPLVARVVAREPALAERLARDLIDSLFLAAPDVSYGPDIVALLVEALPERLAAIDGGMLWRLLQARAKGAQLLGAAVLPARPPETFSVRQTARLGNHALLAVRRWAMAAYDSTPERFQAEAADAVLIVESDWPEVQDFARRHFESWPASVWSPQTIAVVTDSVKPEVLDFARHLLRSRLSPADAAAQLTRLLEHPAQSMHLLVTELLTEGVAENDEAFDRLMPLARIVMLQVHKGRIAKDRMAAFLHREALRDAARAGRIAALFADLTLSGTARDRSQAIVALRDITEKHPAIASPLRRRPAAGRAA